MQVHLLVNGKPLDFGDTSMNLAGREFLYSKMDNIAHRGGEKPAFLFDYEGKRLALSYDEKNKDVLMRTFQQIVAIKKKMEEEAKQAEEELITPLEEPAEEEADFSMFADFEVDEPAPQPSEPPKFTYETQQTPQAPAQPQVVYMEKEKHTGFWSVGRLVIGILSMVLFIFITFQSCTVGLSNTLQENNALTGSAGFFTAVMFLIAGIVAVCTRNSQGMVAPIITAALYFLGALFTLGAGDSPEETFGDLPYWGGLSAIFGVVFVICAVKTKLNAKKEES